MKKSSLIFLICISFGLLTCKKEATVSPTQDKQDKNIQELQIPPPSIDGNLCYIPDYIDGLPHSVPCFLCECKDKKNGIQLFFGVVKCLPAEKGKYRWKLIKDVPLSGCE
ncbi:MAG: hypothetical protein JWQ54_2179 [Mucilaginibacter sp.]|nr:hypothetical protein [Mucilaginibacter sp.]